ncbi:MAG: hypothetical protein V3R99_06800 [Thermoguttaceae bacterium]
MSPARKQRTPHSGHRRSSDRAAGFDFTHHVRRLCQDMVARVDQLAYVDMTRVAISFSQTRRTTAHGMYASLTPMRFADGKDHTIRRGRKLGVQRLDGPDGREMLYILNFYLPRFLDLGFREKLTTVMHELWHIGPKFDGDVRRFEGRCFAHGASQKKYDAMVDVLTDQWLSAEPPESVCEFLRGDFRDLVTRQGPVFGQKFPAPKLFPLK